MRVRNAFLFEISSTRKKVSFTRLNVSLINIFLPSIMPPYVSFRRLSSFRRHRRCFGIYLTFMTLSRRSTGRKGRHLSLRPMSTLRGFAGSIESWQHLKRLRRQRKQPRWTWMQCWEQHWRRVHCTAMKERRLISLSIYTHGDYTYGYRQITLPGHYCWGRATPNPSACASYRLSIRRRQSRYDSLKALVNKMWQVRLEKAI